MAKRCVALLLAILCAAALALPAGALESAPPEVTAQAYVVMDADTGQILVQQGADEAHYPASITKIMTLALAMEQCGGDMTIPVTVSEAAIAAVEAGSSYVALQPGEEITLADAFYATMLMSANDGANVLAEYVAGSLDAFADRMNEKAAELGMTGTHFVNPSGWHEDDHYTTAADMAALTRWALTVPGFSELFGATRYTMQPTNKQPEQRLFGTDNVMLVTSTLTYEGTIGGKSGWTYEAGYTMVEVARRDGRTLIAVVMGCPKQYDKFKDCIALFDYCFDNFAPAALDTADLALPTVPVVYDGKELGQVSLEATPQFLLHGAYTAADVQAVATIPEQYVYGQPFDAWVTLTLADAGAAMNSAIGAFAVTVNPGDLMEVLGSVSTQTTATARPWYHPLRLLGALLCVVGLLALLVGLRIAYVAYVKAKRRKARAARRAAQLRAQRAAQARAMRTAQEEQSMPPRRA